MVKKEKKYTSKAAFIQNTELKREYENRSFVSYSKLREEELEREGIVTEDVVDERAYPMMRRSNSAAGP